MTNCLERHEVDYVMQKSIRLRKYASKTDTATERQPQCTKHDLKSK